MNEHQMKWANKAHDCRRYRKHIGVKTGEYAGDGYLQRHPSTLAELHPATILAMGLGMLLSKAVSPQAYQCEVCGRRWREGLTR